MRYFYNLLVCIVAAFLCSNIAQAELIQVEINPSSFTVAQAVGPLSGFTVDEPVKFTFEIDDATADTDPTAGAGHFIDPAGSLTVMGLTSGASVTTTNGLTVQIDDLSEFEIQTSPNSTGAGVIDVFGDLDFDSATDIFASADSLSAWFAGLPAMSTQSGNEAGGIGEGNGATTDGSDVSLVASAGSPFKFVPEPSTSALLALIGFAGIGYRRSLRF